MHCLVPVMISSNKTNSKWVTWWVEEQIQLKTGVAKFRQGDWYLIRADRKCSERFHQSVSLLCQLVSLLGFLLPEWVESKRWAENEWLGRNTTAGVGIPLLTVSVAAGWCPAPFPAEKLLAAARTLTKRDRHELQEHSVLFKSECFAWRWILYLAANPLFQDYSRNKTKHKQMAHSSEVSTKRWNQSAHERLQEVQHESVHFKTSVVSN